MKKTVRIYETLDSATKLNREKTAGGLRLSGVFGKCGVRNANNRVYEKSNYGKMVNMLQEEIAEKHGVMGELEHPNSMNINLNNVSHKIESVQMNEDGTITGTILLLNTTKGKEAQAIVEGGLDLYISSRASGQIDKNGNVILESLKTYDLVGTPGFTEARMSICESLAPNQKVHAINESMYYIVEDEDDEAKDDDKDEKDEELVEEPADAEPCEGPACDSDLLCDILSRLEKIEQKLGIGAEGDDDDEDFNFDDEDFEDTALEECKKWSTNVFAPRVQKWIEEQFMGKVATTVATGVEKWINENYTKRVEGWINEHFATTLENWITEQYSSKINQWAKKELAPSIEGKLAGKIDKWITEEFATAQEEKVSKAINGWVNEHLLPQIDKWVNEEFSQDIYKNVSDYIAESRKTSLDTIDQMLDMIEDKADAKQVVEKLVEESNDEFSGNIALETMPKAYRSQWLMCDEAKKEEILTRARVYNFLNEGVAAKFWAGVDFAAPAVKKQEKPVFENAYSNYENSVIAGIRRFKKY